MFEYGVFYCELESNITNEQTDTPYCIFGMRCSTFKVCSPSFLLADRL